MADIFNPLVQNSLKLPKRNAWINIYDEREETNFFSLSGLNIKFNIESCGETFPRANIGICNLSQENIDYLINFFKAYSPELMQKRIRLYIGYNDVAVCIFDGNVIETTLTSPPDMWFNFNAIFRADALYNNISISLSNEVTVKQVFEAVSSAMNMNLDWQASSQKKLQSFIKDGSIQSILGDLKSIDDSIEYNIIGNFSGDNNGVIRVFDKIDNKEYNVPSWQKIFNITASTGLLGVPQFDCYGAKISCMLNPNIQFNDIIDLTSLYQKIGTGRYIVSKVTHSGELRGDNFKTDLVLRALYGRNPDSSTKKA